ncbi:MAG: cytochrome c [Chloroflexota bacterium]|nr:MAG: cytochrome c [Chloroflexota bacterium]
MSRITILAGAILLTTAIMLTAACGSSSSSTSASPKGSSQSSSPASATSWTAPAEAKNLKAPSGDKAQSAARGKTLFGTSCASCHGSAGKGDGPVGAALKPKPTDLTTSAKNQTEGEIFWKITEGKGAMPGSKSLSEQDRWDLVAYIQSLSN